MFYNLNSLFKGAIVTLFLLLSGCNEPIDQLSKKYEEANEQISANQFDQSLATLNEIPDYRNSKILQSYVNAKLVMSKDESLGTLKEAYDLIFDVPNDYMGEHAAGILDLQKNLIERISPLEFSRVLDFVSEEKYKDAEKVIFNSRYIIKSEEVSAVHQYINFKTQDDENPAIFLFEIPEGYVGPLSEEISTAKKEYIDNVIQFVKKGDHRSVFLKTKYLDEKSEELNALYHYSLIRNSHLETNEIVRSLTSIPFNYSGPFSEEIRTVRDKYSKEIDADQKSDLNIKINEQKVYNYVISELDRLTNKGENYVPEIHDKIAISSASRKFGISNAAVDRIFKQHASSIYQ